MRIVVETCAHDVEAPLVAREAFAAHQIEQLFTVDDLGEPPRVFGFHGGLVLGLRRYLSCLAHAFKNAFGRRAKPPREAATIGRYKERNPCRV